MTSETSRLVDRFLQEYGESHQNRTNKMIHWVCVPIIFWTVVALLWSVPTPPWMADLNWAMVVLALCAIYYVYLSFSLAIGLIAFSLACMGIIIQYQAMTQFPLWEFALIVFVVAWIGQFIGHGIEGKKPSFFKDVQFLLIGPAWLMHFIYRQVGIRY